MSLLYSAFHVVGAASDAAAQWQRHSTPLPGAVHSAADEDQQQAPLTWLNVGIASLLLVINIAISTCLGLGLSRGFIVSAARCVVQLTVLGLFLNQLFLTKNPVYIFGTSVGLGTLAAFEVTYWRSKHRFPGMFAGVFVAITSSAVGVALFGNSLSLNTHPAYTAQKFIPTVGMLFGANLIGVSIGVNAVMSSLDTHRDRIENALCYGASRWETMKPVVVTSLKSATVPSISNMSACGLLSIPGLMVGWSLSGADTIVASRYQMVVMIMLTASTALSTMLAVIFSASVLINSTPMLRLDLLTANKPKAPVAASGANRTTSRMALIRAGRRPKADLYLPRKPSSVAVATATTSSSATIHSHSGVRLISAAAAGR
ncbi:hypothetical protein IWW37_005748 [Coemansia sp. RSA 2050]|nr:hypothetical protein IWW37_005748 [Coemansia sp. RSA 2050]KAJ2731624.1 hypothetical protein IW152_004390 [Coemansia sp. BCRC 34962]